MSIHSPEYKVYLEAFNETWEETRRQYDVIDSELDKMKYAFAVGDEEVHTHDRWFSFSEVRENGRYWSVYKQKYLEDEKIFSQLKLIESYVKLMVFL